MEIGQVLGKYELTEPIGSGTLADVYKGTQAGLDRAVAIRVLPAARATDAATLRRFRQESQAAARLSHPNILTIYDSGEQGGHHYYVMEFLAPEDLRKRLDDGGPGDLKEAVRISVDILKALDHCHQRDLAHGAVSAAAVRFDLRGNAILTDFGRASPTARPGDDLHQLGELLDELVLGCGEEPIPPELKALIQRFAEVPRVAPPTSALLKELQRVERRLAIRQLSRQVDAPGYERPSGAYTGSYSGSYSGMTGSIDGPTGVSGVDSMIQSEGFVSLVQSLTGGYGDVTQRETQLRLAVVLGPFLILAVTGFLYATGVVGSPPLRLLEQSKDIQGRSCEVRWRSSAPCYSFVEYYLSPDRKHRTALAPEAATEFRKELTGLKANTKYFFRFGFSHDTEGGDPYYSTVYEFRTRPEVRIRDIQVVDRKPDQVTIRWSTNLETGTRVRLGTTTEYGRLVENPQQTRELDHSIVIRGLQPETSYHFQIVAADPTDTRQESASEDRRFITRRLTETDPRPLVQLAHSYIDKLRRMTPDEKEKLRRSLSEFLPTVEDLTSDRLKNLAQGRTTVANFHERRLFLALWIERLRRSGRELPSGISKPGTTVQDEAEYLKSLYEIDAKAAATKLDRCMASVAHASGLR